MIFTTLNIYTHITNEMQENAAANIDRGIAKAEVTEGARAEILRKLKLSNLSSYRAEDLAQAALSRLMTTFGKADILPDGLMARSTLEMCMGEPARRPRQNWRLWLYHKKKSAAMPYSKISKNTGSKQKSSLPVFSQSGQE